MEYGSFYIFLACAFGFFMAWGVGANDVANAMGTSVGSKAITLRQAIIIAAIFESAGALLAGGEVTNTIRKEIIDASALINDPEILVYGMLAALLAAGSWLLLASHYGWPVSTTHTIVGAIIGFGLVSLGIEGIYWEKVIEIFLSWIITPLISGVTAYLVFRSIQYFIFSADDPFHAAKRYVPYYIFLVALLVSMVTLTKGLKHVGFHLSFQMNLLTSVGIAGLALLLGILLLRKVEFKPSAEDKFRFKQVERIFALLMIFTASAMAFSHGSNDVANAIGPLAAVVSIIQSGGLIGQKAQLPLWILLLGAGGIVAGLAMYGHKVIATIGEHITELTPSHGFAAELATASTVVLATSTGMPISTTQTLVGAVLGVGFARGIGALNINVIRNIFMSWMITLPAGASFSILFFFIIKGLAEKMAPLSLM